MARLKKRADGRYCKQVYIGLVNGKKQYKSFFGATQKEAESKAAEFKAAIGKGLDPSQSKSTVKGIADSYVSTKKAQGIGASWLRSIGNHVDHLSPLWQMQAAAVKSAHLQDQLNALADSGLSRKTLSQIHGTWSAIFEQAIPEIVQYNPCSKVTIPAGKPAQIRQPLDDIQQAWVRDTPHRARRAAMIMMYSGLRRGELAALTWADIDLNACTITVNKSIDSVTGDVKSPKTAAGVRVVNIPRVLADFLALERQRDRCLFVVHTTDGKRMSNTAWRRLWESYMNDLNIKYGYNNSISKHATCNGKVPVIIRTFTPHQLRHTFCTMLYLAGVDAITARDQMGHSSINTTLAIYTHLDKQYKRRSMDKLDEYIGNNNTSHGKTNTSHIQVSGIFKTAF